MITIPNPTPTHSTATACTAGHKVVTSVLPSVLPSVLRSVLPSVLP
jgi:hypothetical protein